MKRRGSPTRRRPFGLRGWRSSRAEGIVWPPSHSATICFSPRLPRLKRCGCPMQFHTGFGDRDADLRQANPLHLRTVIERFPRLPIVLLHAGWPAYREAGHLAAIYANVWVDLSLAIPFATAGIPAMLRDVLGMAPCSKVLFATDAFTMPEIYWLAARWGRWGIGNVLDEFVEHGWFGIEDAQEAAQRILNGNARGLYGP
ncbi:MAG: amidohydrolase family protein [Caldilineaceae bacterium]|nr:amidohydrolase family protein [Caldilineaceae bacterium]